MVVLIIGVILIIIGLLAKRDEILGVGLLVTLAGVGLLAEPTPA